MIKKLEIDSKKESKKIIEYIQWCNKYLKTEGCVIGLSGGVDSSLCARLAVEALGKDNVLGVMMPARDSNPLDLILAKRLAKELSIRFEIKPITPLLDLYNVYELAEKYDFETEIKPGWIERERYGHLLSYPKLHSSIMKLRARAYVLTDYAYRNSYLQCQTINRTEKNLTWYDVFGDMVGDVAFLEHLWKTQIYEIARFFELDEEIIHRPACSGLYFLTDLEEIEMTFEKADTILYHLDEGILDIEELQKATGLSKKDIEKIKVRFLESKENLIRPLNLEFYTKKEGMLNESLTKTNR